MKNIDQVKKIINSYFANNVFDKRFIDGWVRTPKFNSIIRLNIIDHFIENEIENREN